MQFFADLAGLFKIGVDDTRVSVLVFSESARLVFSLNRFNNLADIQQEILNIPFEGQTANTPEALYQTDLQCFNVANGDRADADNMVIIGIDGNPFPAYRRGATLQIARGLINKGIKIAAIGINDVDEGFLQGLSFGNNYFRAPDFPFLRNLPRSISGRICRAAQTGKPRDFQIDMVLWERKTHNIYKKFTQSYKASDKKHDSRDL